MTKRIEIWSKERWDKVFEEAQDKLESLGARLADLGL
jgi:DNA-binding transcriptional regulator/RsmH inhibitor MraZ